LYNLELHCESTIYAKLKSIFPIPVMHGQIARKSVYSKYPTKSATLVQNRSWKHKQTKNQSHLTWNGMTWDASVTNSNGFVHVFFLFPNGLVRNLQWTLHLLTQLCCTGTIVSSSPQKVWLILKFKGGKLRPPRRVGTFWSRLGKYGVALVSRID